MILAGWNCAECLSFNGEEKSPRDECRSCGSPRRTLGLDLEAYMRRMRQMEENLASAQEASGRLLLEKRVLAEENERLKVDLKSEVRISNKLGDDTDEAIQSNVELRNENYDLAVRFAEAEQRHADAREAFIAFDQATKSLLWGRVTEEAEWGRISRAYLNVREKLGIVVRPPKEEP